MFAYSWLSFCKSRELQTLVGVQRIKVPGGGMTSFRVQQRVMESLTAYQLIVFMTIHLEKGIDLATDRRAVMGEEKATIEEVNWVQETKMAKVLRDKWNGRRRN